MILGPNLTTIQIYEVARKKKMGTFQCGIPYPLNWIVTQFCRIERQGIPAIDYVYVAEKIEVGRILMKPVAMKMVIAGVR